MARLDRRKILRYRYQANGLQRRRQSKDLVAAARPGLQDSSPRSAVLSLHARIKDVTSETWRDRSLVQVWGPRGAVYLVPKEDLGLFTYGLLPRDPDRIADLQRKAQHVVRILDGRPQRHSAVMERVPIIGDIRELLWASTTGRFLPIWDASSTAMYPAEPAEADPEESRLELARRFLHFMGPTTTKALQWWTDSTPQDAMETMAALGPELATVDVGDEEVLMLEEDVPKAIRSRAAKGLHLLPPEDVYISRLCAPLLVPGASLYSRLFPKAPPPGAVLIDGEVVATWRRRGRRFTVVPFPGIKTGELLEPVLEAARGLPLTGDSATTVVDWHSD